MYDPHAVAIIRGKIVVGHAPQNICGFFWKFLSLPNASARARVLHIRVNHGAGYCLEVPVCFVFQGHVKGVEWVKKKIEEAEKKVQAHFEKMHEKCCLEMFLPLLCYLYEQNISY